MQQNKSRRKSIKISRHYFLGILLVIIFFLIIYYSDAFFKVKKIEIIGSAKTLSIQGIESWNDQNMFLISSENIRQELITANPLLKDIKVEKIYPDMLRFTPSMISKSAFLVVDQGYFLIGEEGRILQKVKKKESGVPVINYYQKLHYTSWQSGDYVQYKDILTALHFLKKAKDLGLKIDAIDIVGLNMIALHLQEQKILFTTDKDKSIQDYQLETIIRQFKINGKQFKVLDLRFDKPIIQFK